MALILRIALSVPVAHYFDYLAPANLPSIPLKKGKPLSLATIPLEKNNDIKINSSTITLNEHQLTTIATVTQSLGQFKPFLLHGVTGSGKTEVYLEIIEAVLQRKEQVLVLLPE